MKGDTDRQEGEGGGGRGPDIRGMRKSKDIRDEEEEEEGVEGRGMPYLTVEIIHFVASERTLTILSFFCFLRVKRFPETVIVSVFTTEVTVTAGRGRTCIDVDYNTRNDIRKNVVQEITLPTKGLREAGYLFTTFRTIRKYLIFYITGYLANHS